VTVRERDRVREGRARSLTEEEEHPRAASQTSVAKVPGGPMLPILGRIWLHAQLGGVASSLTGAAGCPCRSRADVAPLPGSGCGGCRQCPRG